MIPRGQFGGDPVFCYIKAVRSEECARIQENFQETFAIRNAPESMLLARARHREPGTWHLMWLAAEKDGRALYYKFTPIERDLLPKDATLLVGHRAAFEKFFTYEKLTVPASTSPSKSGIGGRR
jgi:hypothetical protein